MQYQKYLCIDFKTFFSVTVIITLTFKTKNDILQEDYKGDYNSHKNCDVICSNGIISQYIYLYVFQK